MMRKTLAALLAAAAALPLRADEGDVFVSLTRDAAPVDRMPTNVSVLTAAEIERSGAVTLADALESLLSVDVQKGAVPGQYSKARLRGSPASNQVQVVVDDQPVGGVFLQNVDLSQIPAEDVERVEIIRGGASVLYGANTIGGVIHVVTKKARGERALSSVGYEARSFGTHVQRAEIRRPGRADVHLNVSSHRTEGFQRNSDGDGLAVTAGAGYALENGARLSVEATRTDTETGDPWGTAVPIDEWDGRRERVAISTTSRIDQAATRARARAVFPAGPALVTALVYGSNQDYANADGASVYETDQNILGSDLQARLPGKALVGLSYERDEFRAKGEAKLHGTNWAAYAQKTFSWGDVDVLPALRHDQHGAFGGTTNPRLTVVWRAADALKLSANAGRSFRSPTLLDLHQSFPAMAPYFGAFLANPDLRPETAWSYDAGAAVGLGEGATLAVTGFYTRIRERITRTQNAFPAPNTLVNAPRAELSGVEAELAGRWRAFEHRLSYAHHRSIGNSLASSRYVPLAEIARHTVDARLTWAGPRRWEVTGTAKHVSKRHELNDEGGLVIPAHTIVGLRIKKAVLGAELFLAGENLTDRRYADAFGFGALLPQPGRTFRAGATIRFND